MSSPSPDFATVALAWIAGAVLLVPLTGLTARFGLRPLVDAVGRMRRAGAAEELEDRVEELSDEVRRLARLVETGRTDLGNTRGAAA